MTYATGTSNLAQWEWILWAIEGSPFPHERVLDVGAGHGKAAVLLREYLNVKPKRIGAIDADPMAWSLQMSDWTPKDGRRLIGAAHLYDWSSWIDAREYDGWDGWDTVLMADVIEHMPKADGLALIDRIPGQVVISTPLVADVGEHAADPTIPDLERHISQWDIHDFRRTGRHDTHWLRERQYIVRLKPKDPV